MSRSDQDRPPHHESLPEQIHRGWNDDA